MPVVLKKPMEPIQKTPEASIKKLNLTKKVHSNNTGEGQQSTAHSPLNLLARNHEILKGMNGDHYTLQLIGVSTKQAAEKYLLKNTQLKNLMYMQSKRHHENWYVVVYGDYADKAAAIDAAKQPAITSLRVTPWVRTFSSLQADISTK